jgi:hypothetical protein
MEFLSVQILPDVMPFVVCVITEIDIALECIRWKVARYLR